MDQRDNGSKRSKSESKEQELNMTEKAKKANEAVAENEQAATVQPAAQEAPVVVTKQVAAIQNLKAAIEKAGKKFEMLEPVGKMARVTNNGVEITIGAGGGYNIPSVSTYPKADLATMVKADELFNKQTARRTALAEATKEVPAEQPAEAKKETVAAQ